jgi:hypothetical protein
MTQYGHILPDSGISYLTDDIVFSASNSFRKDDAEVPGTI